MTGRTDERQYSSPAWPRGRRHAAAIGLAAAIAGAASAHAQVAPVTGNPTEGGPYGSLATTVCTRLAGSYCYASSGPDPLGAAAAVRPYLDNAARNWGCTWNASAQPVADLGGGSWSKGYGNETDAAAGCGVAYWNHARQAALFLPRSERGGNLAAAAASATASASSTYNAGTPVGSLIDGNRRGSVWASGGGWSSAANPTVASPQWVQVSLNGSRRIQEIVVTTLQDNYAAPIEPTAATTFATYGIRDFAVQYWSGSGWITAGSITGNNRVMRRFTFAPVQTTAVRVLVTAALQNYARIVEVEAYESPASSSRLAERYASLGGAAGALGLPVANPVGYGWTGATYQQFQHGLLTFIRGQASAFVVGGTAPEERALAVKYAEVFGVSPTAGPAVYGVSGDAACAGRDGLGSCDGALGRYVQWRDTYQGADEMILARTGWTRAVRVPAPIRSAWMARYGSTDPWNGQLGFPVTDLLATGSATHHQEFEAGSILWEPSACTSGAYAARIVSQFRRPIAEGNLTMLCDAQPPANPAAAVSTGLIPFTAADAAGSFRFRSQSQSGWFTGASVRFDDGRSFDVDGPIYSAWIGGATGGGNVADALAETGLASDWGPPASDATCVGNPCASIVQRFAHGTATTAVGGSGIVGWAPTGFDVPNVFLPIERGYANPVPPADRRIPIGHRDGDYIDLVWRNASAATGVTTTLSRQVTPQNGVPGAWTVIKSYPPPTLAKNTFTEYRDASAVNNARNCYRLTLSDGSDSSETPPVCLHTLDGRTVNGVDRSAPRGVSRAQIRLTVASNPDAGTLGSVSVHLDSFGGGNDFNQTYLDSTAAGGDFAPGSTRTYDLSVNGVEDISDIAGITIWSGPRRIEGQNQPDDLQVSRLQLILENIVVFDKTFATPAVADDSLSVGGKSIRIGFDELHSNPLWSAFYAPHTFSGFTAADFTLKLDSTLATAVFTAPGAPHHGSRLRDGHPTTLSRPSGYGQDRMHVSQKVTADVNVGIFCSVDYDLRITARDIDGNEVSPLVNGGAIYTTRISVEHPNVSCGGSTFMHDYVYTIFALTQSPDFYPTAMAQLSRDMEKALAAQSPSELQSAPLSTAHFCFPRAGEGLVPGFQNGLSICAD
jgi:hypothetical protein